MSLSSTSRREFLENLGRGMIAAGVGFGVASDLGLVSARAVERESNDRLDFGEKERLVDLIQETSPDRILQVVKQTLAGGTEARDLVAAAALANARKFGGEDYIGFHTFMAFVPALAMSQELPASQRALPLMKVLYRNATRIRDTGGPSKETLKSLGGIATTSADTLQASALRNAIHQKDVNQAENLLNQAASADEAWNCLLETVQDATEVHRVVLAQRSWDIRTLVGEEYASTMLRQSLRNCVKMEPQREKYFGGVTAALTKAFEQHKLADRPRGTRSAEDAWIIAFSETLFTSTPEQAADAVAAALAEGFSPEPISHAISLAANQLVLRDAGRSEREKQANKPVGSVHGDSIGVHACDTANAWRQIALSCSPRNSAASLILSGYNVAQDRIQRGGNFLEWKPRPYVDQLEKLAEQSPDELLKRLDGAIRENNQNLACAAAHKYLELGHASRSLCDLLLSYALSEDGALHAEKYYRTATDEYGRLPSAFRNRQFVALARVSASAFGYAAPGVAEARKLLET